MSTIRYSETYKRMARELNAIRLGEKRSGGLDAKLAADGLAVWIGGDLFITAAGRAWLANCGVQP